MTAVAASLAYAARPAVQSRDDRSSTDPSVADSADFSRAARRDFAGGAVGADPGKKGIASRNDQTDNQAGHSRNQCLRAMHRSSPLEAQGGHKSTDSGQRILQSCWPTNRIVPAGCRATSGTDACKETPSRERPGDPNAHQRVPEGGNERHGAIAFMECRTWLRP